MVVIVFRTCVWIGILISIIGTYLDSSHWPNIVLIGYFFLATIIKIRRIAFRLFIVEDHREDWSMLREQSVKGKLVDLMVSFPLVAYLFFIFWQTAN